MSFQQRDSWSSDEIKWYERVNWGCIIVLIFEICFCLTIGLGIYLIWRFFL